MTKGVKLLLVFLILFCVYLFPSKALAASYFVSTDGNDANDGTEERPWRTIQKAADSADGEVNVKAGEYNERVRVNRHGLSFLALGLVRMKGFLINADQIAVKNFEITNTDDNDTDGPGIFVLGNNCQLENNNIYETRREGVRLNNVSQGCRIRYNRIRRTHRIPVTPPGPENTNTVIEGNEISEVISEATPTSESKQVKPGDANNDNKVDDTDFSQFWIVNYLKSLMGYTFADFNNSGKIDGVDYIIWLKNYGK